MPGAVTAPRRTKEHWHDRRTPESARAAERTPGVAVPGAVTPQGSRVNPRKLPRVRVWHTCATCGQQRCITHVWSTEMYTLSSRSAQLQSVNVLLVAHGLDPREL